MVDKEALEYITRCWSAEETNAERIANRKTLIVGLPAGFLAVVGLNVDQAIKLVHAAMDASGGDADSGNCTLATDGVIFLPFGLLFLFVSIGYAVGVGLGSPERAGLASRLLMPGAQLPALAVAGPDKAREIAFEKAVAASAALHNLNAQVENRLSVACEWLLSGLVLCFLALLIYAHVVP